MQAEIKLPIQKLKKESKKKTKIINYYSQLIKTIKKEYQLVAKENLKKIRLQIVKSYKKPTAINRTQQKGNEIISTKTKPI